MQVLYGVAIYLAAGLLVALSLVTFGIARVLSERRPASIGARLLLVPGATVLWPYVLVRLIRGRRAS
ncbi:MAG: hypothetical protein WBP94_08635 [Rhodomicrobiaceae bacterium]